MIPRSRIVKAAAILGCSADDLTNAIKKRRVETLQARAKEQRIGREQIVAKAALRRVYTAFGPRHRSEGKIRVLSPAAYAKLTKRQVDEQWDFENRHLMHVVAKALVRGHR